jgi:hypothetical protein
MQGILDQFQAGMKDRSLNQIVQKGLGLTQPPTPWAQGQISPEIKRPKPAYGHL